MSSRLRALAFTLSLAALSLSAGSMAQAASTIVNLNASSSNPNAGGNSGTYAYNPATLTLAAGVYTVSVIGIAQGGLYDAFTVYAPDAGNAAYLDKDWSVSLDGTSAAYTQAAIGGTVSAYDGSYKAGRYNTAALSLAAYASSAGYTFTLTSPQSVSFYIDDSGYPFFADDSGGVSLLVSAVPEPAAFAIFGLGVFGVILFVHRRRAGMA